MSQYVKTLYTAIKRYHLADRSEEANSILEMIERDQIKDNVARAYLYRFRPLVDDQERRMNLLHRAPLLAEIYPNRAPDIVLGHLAERPDVPVGISLTGPAQQIYAGTTGAGKTTALRRTLLGIHEQNQAGKSNVVILVFDRKGVDFVDFGRSLGWDVYDVEDGLRLGLQAPQGCPPRKWASHVASAFASRASLKFGESTFANLVRWLVNMLNPNSGESAAPLWPSLPLVLEVARELPDLAFAEQSQYVRSLRQVLEALVEGTGELFNTFDGFDVERHLVAKRKSAVIRMPMMSPPWVRQFIVDLLILQVLYGRMHRQQCVPGLEVLFVIDEADADVSREGEGAFPGGMSPCSLAMRMGREFGIGIALGLASLDSVAPHVLNSATYQFLFCTPDAASTAAAARTLMLPRGAEGIIPALTTGECLFRGPTWPHAVLAKIDPVYPSRGAAVVPDRHPFVPSKTLGELPKLIEAVKSFSKKRRYELKSSSPTGTSALPEKALQLLLEWVANPFTPLARVYDKIGRPSPEKDRAIREALADGGYATFQEIRIGKRKMLLFEPREAAWTFLKTPKIAYRGRGGVAHRHMAHWVAAVASKRGFDETLIEWQVPGTRHAADVAWRENGSWNAVEIVESCETNLVSHLETMLLSDATGIGSVTVVASQKGTLGELRKTIEKCVGLGPVLGKIRYVPVEYFLKELWP